MGKTKFDLIAASKRKGYRIAVIVLVVLGVLMLGLGLILKATVTDTTTPNRLDVSFSGQTGNRPFYSATISKSEWLQVDCGVGDQALTDPIQFEYYYGAENLFVALPNAYRAGMFWLQLKDDLTDGQTGVMVVRCGSQAVQIEFTYVDPNPATE